MNLWENSFITHTLVFEKPQSNEFSINTAEFKVHLYYDAASLNSWSSKLLLDNVKYFNIFVEA